MPSSLRGPKTLFEWLEPDYYRRSRWLRRWVRILGWGAVAVGVLVVGATLWGGMPSFYQAGPLTSPHRMFSGDCNTCHTAHFAAATRFRPGAADAHSVTDQACSRCHEGGPHHAELQDHTPACADCHHEHRGRSALVEVPDVHCVACHGDLHVQGGGPPGVQNVHRFATDHPPFAVPSRDPSHIRFNHALHLQAEGIFSTERDPTTGLPRRVRLDCADCHQLDAERHYVRPVNYEAHCARCHPLSVQLAGTWNDADADTEEEPAAARDFRSHPAPHVAPAEVRAALRDRLADLVRAHPELVADKVTATPKRPIPGAPPPEALPAGDARAWTDYQLRSMEHVLFDGPDACHRCHVEAPGGRAADRPGALPRFEPSNVLARWFPAAVFDHGSHQMLRCTECHAARESTKATDVLMPTIQTCQQCHNPAVGVRSNCIDCHRYHEHPAGTAWTGTFTIDEALSPSRKPHP